MPNAALPGYFRLVQRIGPVWETYCKLLGAGAFADGDSQGEIVGKLRAAGPGHQLFSIEAVNRPGFPGELVT